MKLNILTCTALCVSMASININAQESRWGLGLGGMADRQGYVDVDSKITV